MGNKWYVDPAKTQTSDTGIAGTSHETALRYIDNGLRKLNRTEDQFLYLRGGHYHNVAALGAGLISIGVSNVTVMPYWMPGDDPSDPIIDGITYLPKKPAVSVWTKVGAATKGGYIWSTQVGTAEKAVRIFEGSYNNGNKIGDRFLGKGLRHTPNDAARAPAGVIVTVDTVDSIKQTVCQTDPWYGSGVDLGYKIYMWTPDDSVDPSEYYNGLGVLQNGARTMGFTSAFGLYYTKNLTIRNITVQGSSGAAFGLLTADTAPIVSEDILIANCKSTAALNHFRFSQSSSLAYNTVVRRVTLLNCTADTHTCEQEQEINMGYNRLSNSDQFLWEGKIEDCVAIGCTSINPTHSAISVNGYTAVNGKPVRCGFIRHTSIAESWVAYSRGAGMDNCEPSCFIYESTFIGQNTNSQFTGGGRIIGNKWLGLRRYIRKPPTSLDSDGWITLDCYRAALYNPNNVGTDNMIDLRPENLVFANNSCDGSYGTPIQINIYTPAGAKPLASIPDNSFLFANNLLIDTKPGRAGKPYIKTFQQGGYVVGTQMFHNNLIYNGTNTPSSVVWNGTTYASLHNAPGHVDNIIANPVVDILLQPLENSPLAQAGRFCGPSRDNKGKRFGLKPSIGAYEITPKVNRVMRV